MNLSHRCVPCAPEAGAPGGGAEAGGPFAPTKDQLAPSAKSAAARVKSAATETAHKARDEAERLALEKKDTAASRLSDYSSAVHESARSLEEKDPNIAWFTHRAADRLQQVAHYLRESDWQRFRGDCEGVARRHPAVFFGGLFVGGLLLGNLIKASGRKARPRDADPNDNAGELAASEAGADWMSPAPPPTETQTELPTALPGSAI